MIFIFGCCSVEGVIKNSIVWGWWLVESDPEWDSLRGGRMKLHFLHTVQHILYSLPYRHHRMHIHTHTQYTMCLVFYIKMMKSVKYFSIQQRVYIFRMKYYYLDIIVILPFVVTVLFFGLQISIHIYTHKITSGKWKFSS